MEVERDDDVPIDAAFTGRVRQVMARLRASDFERVDPPVDLWDRIAASIESDRSNADPPTPSPKTPPARSGTATTVVEYSIDADDALVDVGEGWARFARDNHAPELVTPMPRRMLWTYFDRAEVRDLWQLLVRRVRASGSPARVPLRCDAPHARRWFEMSIEPRPDDSVRFRSVLVHEETRPPVALLEPDVPRDPDADPVPVCSWCNRGLHGTDWLDIEALVAAARLFERTSPPAVDYGICAACRDDMSADLLVAGDADTRAAGSGAVTGRPRVTSGRSVAGAAPPPGARSRRRRRA